MARLHSLDLDDKLDEYDTHEQQDLLRQLSIAAREDIDEQVRTTIAARLRAARVKPKLRSNVEKTLALMLKRHSDVLHDEHKSMYGGRMDGLARQHHNHRLLDIFTHLRSSLATSQAVRLHKRVLDRTLEGISHV